MNPVFLATSGEELVAIVAVGGLILGALSIISGVVRHNTSTKQREQTKREIAAYIAEGSMTPEQGERILNAGANDAKA